MSADAAPRSPGVPPAAGEPVPARAAGSQGDGHRVEDARLLTGHGRFVSHLSRPGQLVARFVRSPHARARIGAIDVQAAREVPGVVAVLTADDCPVATMPAVNPLVPGMAIPPRALWSAREVGYVGEPVAIVLARTEFAALDAIDAVAVDWEPIDAPIEQPVFALAFGAGDADAAFAQAAHVVSVSVAQPRVAAVPMEPRSVLAEWADGRMTVWVGTQAASRARTDLAQALGLADAQVRVIAPDVGGAFGARASLCPEEILVALAARATGCPVKWTSTRGEDFASGFHGRGGQLEGELALDASGRATGLRARLDFPLGAWLAYSAAVPARNAARILPGPYAVPAVAVAAQASCSATAPVTIYRGAGRPEAALLMERLIDEAARVLDLDPVALRRLNLEPASSSPVALASASSGPPPGRLPGAAARPLPSGDAIDSADFAGLLDRACALFDYDAARDRQRRRRAAGERVGIGVGLYVEPCGSGWESARVTLEADGTVTVASGSTAQGQGHETSYAVLAAQALGCAPQAVRVVHGDTDRCPEGIGALASRSIAIGGSAVVQAAQQAARRRTQGEPLPIVAQARYVAPAEAWASGCVIAEVSVAADTAQPRIERIVWVDDAGRLVSPVLAEGQLLGGLAQGVGQAMMECIVYDDFGQLLTGSLMDYALPRAEDVPPVTLGALPGGPTPTDANLLGAKGVGEAGCIGVPAALANAFHDALAPLGVRRLEFPFTAPRLWAAIEAARAGSRRERSPTFDPGPASGRSESVNEPGVPERRARRRPIEAQSAAISVDMASICNDERAPSGVTSGHVRFVHRFSLAGVPR